ncbi:MAG: DUF4382 domain-containing protein [Pseudomonadota bacterium]
MAMFFLLQGCGNENVGAEESGDVIIGITDAEGDFLNYAVDVTGLTLTKASGAVVDVLPVNTRIDFAQLTEMTEFFTAATIPEGRYVKATMILDYSNADVQVEDANGNPVPVTVQDSNGNPLTTWEVAVNLSNANALVIAPGVPAHLTLDFDLNASHTVDVAQAEAIAQPVLVADVKLADPKPHRVRGLLQTVDQGAGTIRMNLRPFFHQTGHFGAFTAYVNSSTVYEIDGASYTGGAGLTAQAQQAANSWVVVYGELNTVTKHFEATEVYAGSSVPGADKDVVTGVVLSRAGDMLMVNAGSIVRTDGSLVFNKNVTVTLDANTIVKRQLSTSDYTKDDISVGQRIVLWGTLNSAADTMNAPAHLRMLLNQFTGTVVSNAGGELVMDLQRLNGRLPAQFNFSGTGTTGADDADPDQYQVDLGTLTPSVTAGDPVKVRGFVRPFGSAPLDFEATTVIDVADVPAVLVAGWGLGTPAPFTAADNSLLVLNDQGMGLLHHVSRAWVNIDLWDDNQATSLVPTPNGRGIFAINQAGTIYVYFTFSEFVTAVNEQISAGRKTQRIWAVGAFDDDSETLTTTGATLVMF